MANLNFSSSIFNRLPDRPYIYLLYYKYQRKWPNLRNPETFGDYIQWLKLNGKLDRYSQYADKYSVRKYVEEKIGAQHLIPLLGVWDKAEEIDYAKLPNSFVLKATHGCGYNIICKNKAGLDKESVRLQLNSWLAENFYLQERETQYKYCQPKIIAEAYMEDRSGQLTDYKIHCSKGEPKIIQVNANRFSGKTSDELYDMNWGLCQGVQSSTFLQPDNLHKKPKQLKALTKIARKLSADFPYVRVDLYVVGNKVYFGELTFTPGSGLVTFAPKDTGSQEFVRQLDIDLGAYA